MTGRPFWKKQLEELNTNTHPKKLEIALNDELMSSLPMRLFDFNDEECQRQAMITFRYLCYYSGVLKFDKGTALTALSEFVTMPQSNKYLKSEALVLIKELLRKNAGEIEEFEFLLMLSGIESIIPSKNDEHFFLLVKTSAVAFPEAFQEFVRKKPGMLEYLRRTGIAHTEDKAERMDQGIVLKEPLLSFSKTVERIVSTEIERTDRAKIASSRSAHYLARFEGIEDASQRLAHSMLLIKGGPLERIIITGLMALAVVLGLLAWKL